MRRRRRFSILLLIIAVIMVAVGVCVFLSIEKLPEGRERETVKHFSFSSDKSLNEWEEKFFAGNYTRYSAAEYGEKNCVEADSGDSASALFYRQQLSCDRYPFVSWDWKAEKFPSRQRKEVLGKKAEFDFVAQVYVVFHARFFLNAKAIQYVWTEDLPVGTASASPYTKKVRLMVLQSGPSEEWKHEERNIREDFKNLFGEELEKDVAAISFMTDSDSTGSSARAYYGDITLGYLEETVDTQASGEEKKKAKWIQWLSRFRFAKSDKQQ